MTLKEPKVLYEQVSSQDVEERISRAFDILFSLLLPSSQDSASRPEK